MLKWDTLQYVYLEPHYAVTVKYQNKNQPSNKIGTKISNFDSRSKILDVLYFYSIIK
jgi:hypothetical protein